ncbi:MAG: phosphoribosylanthranilate isomerase [Desulfurella sp.]|jgi:phosphoribosylanthranilate isomerase
MVVRVQIAGLKNEYDSLNAVFAGADAIGLVVGVTHSSGDEIEPQLAKEIFLSLPPFICKTLITHYTRENDIIDLINITHPTAVQLHSTNISIDTIKHLKATYPFVKFIGVVHANLPNALDRAQELSDHVDAIFTDTKTKDRLGGTGQTHDWNISAKIARFTNKPLILAGGLNPENVLDAIKVVSPYGVDVNTGVKVNAVFSFERMCGFINEVRAYNTAICHSQI